MTRWVRWSGRGQPVSRWDWAHRSYAKLDGDLAAAMMSINARQGRWKSGPVLPRWRRKVPSIATRSPPEGFLSNHCRRGVLGGISTGQPVDVAVAFKPTSSLRLAGQNGRQRRPAGGNHHYREDTIPALGIRAVPIVEAMLALTIMGSLSAPSRPVRRCSATAPTHSDLRVRSGLSLVCLHQKMNVQFPLRALRCSGHRGIGYCRAVRAGRGRSALMSRRARPSRQHPMQQVEGLVKAKTWPLGSHLTTPLAAGHHFCNVLRFCRVSSQIRYSVRLVSRYKEWRVEDEKAEGWFSG